MQIDLKQQQPAGEILWKPRILSLADERDRTFLNHLQQNGHIWAVQDTIAQQLTDLVIARHPDAAKNGLPNTKRQTLVEEITMGKPLHLFGKWIYYPWSGLLVHTLPPPEFHELRLNRNRNKITADEQKQLSRLTIGIVGLSVGNSVVLSLALEGIGGSFLLADFDHLELSNLNRIRATVADIGLPKSILAARQMFELNPFLDIQLFTDGISPDNIDSFLAPGPKIDYLIDECDDIRVKILLREKARELRIPVIMETSDRGMLDIERFDSEPARPIFHGLLGDLKSSDIPQQLSNEEKIKYVLPITGLETLSSRIAASMIEIGETLHTWPQLGSEVLFGGAVVATAVRQLALDAPITSGRRYLDVGALLDQEAYEQSRSDGQQLVPLQNTNARNRHHDTADEFIEFIVSCGILAPSGGNSQPWCFTTNNKRIRIFHDRERSRNTFDVDHRGAYAALGGAIKNMQIAALHQGFGAEIHYFPEARPHAGDNPVAEITFQPITNMTQRQQEQARLFPMIEKRFTDRTNYARKPLSASKLEALANRAGRLDCSLDFITSPEALRTLGDILGRGDHLRLLTPVLQREMMAEVRWRPEDVDALGDGIPIDTLGLTLNQQAALRILRRNDVVDFLRSHGLGNGLKSLSADAIQSASAVGLLSTNGNAPETFLRGGQAMQELWLLAQQMNLAWHPMTALLYMFNIPPAQQGQLFTPEQIRILDSLKTQFQELFPGADQQKTLMLFRLSEGQVLTHKPRAIRRTVRDVLSIQTD